MLIEFSLSNFRSFHERQTFSMVAEKGKELQENVVSKVAQGTPDLLKSSVIYGPNASGKSNLIQALFVMQDFVVNSARQGQAGDKPPFDPFLLVPDVDEEENTSEFEVLFVEEGVRYQYGFAISEEMVEEEWLLAYPTGQPQKWFHRVYDHENDQYAWKFSAKFKGPKKMYQEASRKNALFLSTAIQLNSEMLKPVFHWFETRLLVIPINHGVFESMGGYSAHRCQDSKYKQVVLDFLEEADLNIHDIKIENKKLESDELPDNLPETIRNKLLEDEFLNVKFLHKLPGSNKTIEFSLGQESDGTRKMFGLSGPWIDLLFEGKVLVMDEFDNHFHPRLIDFLIQQVHRKSEKGAQLIFTTHNVNLMENNFRRDQFWFVEKNRDIASELSPLSKFSVRKGEAIKNNYLRGKYGAIPIIDEV